MFRAIVAWLSKRFPQQLVVSVQEYKELREEVASYNVMIQGVNQLNERITALERQIKQLNEANGFINQPKGSFRLER